MITTNCGVLRCFRSGETLLLYLPMSLPCLVVLVIFAIIVIFGIFVTFMKPLSLLSFSDLLYLPVSLLCFVTFVIFAIIVIFVIIIIIIIIFAQLLYLLFL